MSYSKISYSSRVHRTDIKYEHIIRSRRGLSMANDTNPDKQQSNRLKLELAAIEKQKAQLLRIQAGRTAQSPRGRTARSSREEFTQDRLNTTLKKYGMELPLLRQPSTVPPKHNSAPPNRVTGPKGPRDWLARNASCPSRPAYSQLLDPAAYSGFCEKLLPLTDRSQKMKEYLYWNIAGRPAVIGCNEEKEPDELDLMTDSSSEEDEEHTIPVKSTRKPTKSTRNQKLLQKQTIPIAPPKITPKSARTVRLPKTQKMRTQSAIPTMRPKFKIANTPFFPTQRNPINSPNAAIPYLHFCEDMSSYLRAGCALNNVRTPREEQSELHNWEAYRRSCPGGHVSWVSGPDIVQRSYLSLH